MATFFSSNLWGYLLDLHKERELALMKMLATLNPVTQAAEMARYQGEIKILQHVINPLGFEVYAMKTLKSSGDDKQ